MLQIYREKDKPYYRTGNKVLIAIAAWSLVMFIVAKYYYVWRNKYVYASPCALSFRQILIIIK